MTMPSSAKLLRHRRTRIVATIGPASCEAAVLEQLVHAGVDVFRLNLSHGGHADHKVAYDRIRAAGQGSAIAVLADLCGPKIRVGRLAGGRITVQAGDMVRVTTRDVEGGAGLIPSGYEALARDVHPGDRILLDDGLLELRVESAADPDVTCQVIHGGVLLERKGMNLPGVNVSAPALTEKDRDDAHFALSLGVDFLALSFVRRPTDVEVLKNLIRVQGYKTPVIAKIEKREAVDALDEILDAADGIMVARGDLGVELPPETVPIIQRELVEKSRRKMKPVIVATQMLESMIDHPRPTRAEVSDVSHAVFSGADAVMLSAETAAGAYPVRAVEMMDRVARQVESYQWIEGGFRALTEGDATARGPIPARAAVARSTAQLARDLQVRAIAVRTRSGISAEVVSATRPAAPVLALTMDVGVMRRLNLLWGVIPCLIEPEEFYERPQAAARRLAREYGLAEPGSTLLLLAGFGKNEPMITVLPL
jgi:pyruvate kinase